MNVIVLGKIRESGLSLLRETANVDPFVINPSDHEAVRESVAIADAILIRTSQLTADLIEGAKRLKVVSRYGVGVDNIDVDALTRRGIPVAVVGDANAGSVAEHTMYLMLATMKMGLHYDRAVRSGNWQYRDSAAATELTGKRVLLIGLGRIGSRVAKLCEAFGMEVWFYDLRSNVAEAEPGWQRVTDIAVGLTTADVVSIHTPLGPSTRSLIGAKELALMKPSGILISTSRGGVIDEAAVITALSSGVIRACGLDVFEHEPIESDNPLIQLDNVVLSPHMAALTYECAERMSLAAARNCIDGINGCLDPSRVFNHEALLKLEAAGPCGFQPSTAERPTGTPPEPPAHAPIDQQRHDS